MTSTKTSLLWYHRVAAFLHFCLFVGITVWATQIDDKLWRNNFPVIYWCTVFELVTVIAEVYASFDRFLSARLYANACIERWIEYSITAGIMMVAILQLSNVQHEGILAVGAICTILTMFVGYQVEIDWRTWLFVIGCIVMAIPWIFVLYNLGHYSPPHFVYWIVGSMIVFFGLFAVVAYVGRYDATYHDRDKWYTVLSFTSKIALCLQIGFGASEDREA